MPRGHRSTMVVWMKSFVLRFHPSKEKSYINREPNKSVHTEQDRDEGLLKEFSILWSQIDQVWEQNQHHPAFHGYVSADYRLVFESLAKLQGQVESIVEWGSGLGAVTIMASQMGFDAFGIEAEPELVEYAEQFAKTYGPNARFAEGSFIPDEFDWHPSNGDDVNRTVIDLPAAYEQFGMELSDFDLIYAFPWPDEHQLFHSIARHHGRSGALLLTHDGREGMELVRL